MLLLLTCRKCNVRSNITLKPFIFSYCSADFWEGMWLSICCILMDILLYKSFNSTKYWSFKLLICAQMDKNPINWLPRLHVHEYTKGKNGIEQVFPLSHKADTRSIHYNYKHGIWHKKGNYEVHCMNHVFFRSSQLTYQKSTEKSNLRTSRYHLLQKILMVSQKIAHLHTNAKIIVVWISIPT